MPHDLDLAGTLTLEAERLELRDLWLGSRDLWLGQTREPVTRCGHLFIRSR